MVGEVGFINLALIAKLEERFSYRPSQSSMIHFCGRKDPNMTKAQADRFAKATLQSYKHESVFEVGLDRHEDLTVAAEAFRGLGCQVRVNEGRLCLVVDCEQLEPGTKTD